MDGIETKNVFIKLAARFDDPEKIKSLPEILKLMITEKEAGILLYLPGTVQEVQNRSGEDLDQTKSVLEKCFRNGILVRTKQRKDEFRYAFPDIYVDTIVSDHRNNALGTRYKELWSQWTKEQRAHREFEIDPEAPPGRRVIPVWEMVHDHDTILPFEDAKAIVEASQCRVVQQCPCRYRTRACDYPVDDICLLFDGLAEDAIERGYGKGISKEKALEVLRRGCEVGLVHVSNGEYYEDATLGAEFICNCCPCCCGLLEPYFSSNREIKIGTNYYAEADSEKCIGCATCEDRCHFDAIKVVDEIAVVHRDKCVGCGLCAYTCEQEAITLRRIKERVYRPSRTDRHFINPRD